MPRVCRLIQTSKIPLPDVRRAALCESVRSVESHDQLRSVFMDAVVGSTFVPDDRKDVLAGLVLDDRWDAVAEAVGAGAASAAVAGPDPATALRTMALAVFSKSRKVSRLPAANRRALGAAIAGTQTRGELMELMLRSLEGAIHIDETSRMLIANDVLEGMFHRLLGPDRFDCDEQLSQSPEVDGVATAAAAGCHTECPVCLEMAPADVGLSGCSHRFCVPCICAWAKGEPTVSCPMCRAVSQTPSADGRVLGTVHSL